MGKQETLAEVSEDWTNQEGRLNFCCLTITNISASKCEEVSLLQREAGREEPLQLGAGRGNHVGEGRGGRQQTWRYFSWRRGGGSRHPGQTRQPRDSGLQSGQLSSPPDCDVDIWHQL